MEAKTKKYLLWGGAAAVGVVLYLGWKNSASSPVADTSKKDKKKVDPKSADTSAVTPPIQAQSLPSTASQYSPVGYPPPSYNYPPPSYSPNYSSYPQYQQPYIPPYVRPYVPPYTSNPCQSVVGLTRYAAMTQLQSMGIQPKVVSINGRPVATSQISYPYGVSTASLYIVNGVVTQAYCSGTQYTQPLAY